MRRLSHPHAVIALLTLLIAVAVWFAPGAVHGDDRSGRFTVAVIPDTQFYVDSGNNYSNPVDSRPNAVSDALEFRAETEWLAGHKESLNLAFVTHVGDVVQNGDGTLNGTTPLQTAFPVTAEWDRAFAAMKVLADAGIPFGMSPGNHDYDNYMYATGSRPLVSTKMWKQYFGSDSRLFRDKRWYGGASDSLSCNPGLSSYQTFSAGGRKFLHISLQLEAGASAIAWAQGVINAHKGYATIVTTHSYLSPFKAGDMEPPESLQGGKVTGNPANYNAASFLVNSPCGWNGAQDVFADLVYPNDQIFLVISGHSYNSANSQGVSQGEGIRVDNNAAGHPVYQVLTDYQANIIGHDGVTLPTPANPYPDPGGDGWIRLMTFDMGAGSIHFWTYSPLMWNAKGIPGRLAGQCDGAPCNCQTNQCENTFSQPAAFSDFYEIPMPEQVTNAPRAWGSGPHGGFDPFDGR